MFDPEKVDYYNAPWSPVKAEGRERHQQWVQAQDYDRLLKLLRATESWEEHNFQLWKGAYEKYLIARSAELERVSE